MPSSGTPLRFLNIEKEIDKAIRQNHMDDAFDDLYTRVGFTKRDFELMKESHSVRAANRLYQKLRRLEVLTKEYRLILRGFKKHLQISNKIRKGEDLYKK